MSAKHILLDQADLTRPFSKCGAPRCLWIVLIFSGLLRAGCRPCKQSWLTANRVCCCTPALGSFAPHPLVVHTRASCDFAPHSVPFLNNMSLWLSSRLLQVSDTKTSLTVSLEIPPKGLTSSHKRLHLLVLFDYWIIAFGSECDCRRGETFSLYLDTNWEWELWVMTGRNCTNNQCKTPDGWQTHLHIPIMTCCTTKIKKVQVET